MRLIITRHGETEENKQGIIQGHLPGILSELGKEQAKKLAKRLKEEKIDLILSSDLARASDTAKEIVKFHPEIPFELKEELRERDWGKFDGKRKDDIDYWAEIEVKEVWSDDLIAKYGGETPQEATKRIIQFKDELLQNFGDKTILIVTHNTIGNLLLDKLIKKFSQEGLKNAAITIFEFDENKEPKLVLLNCVKHLEN